MQNTLGNISRTTNLEFNQIEVIMDKDQGTVLIKFIRFRRKFDTKSFFESLLNHIEMSEMTGIMLK